MPGILEDPQVVRDALPGFHDLVANDCPRRRFAEDLTCWFGADRTTVCEIHCEFAPTTAPSGLNRFRTAAAGWPAPVGQGRWSAA